jgi:hypothetical protein
MTKPFLEAFSIIFLVAMASCDLAKGNKVQSPTEDLVGTIVAGTLEARLSATPAASSTPEPSLTPTITPTPTLPLPVPPDWGVYWNQEYGFAFSHPNLINCHFYETHEKQDDSIPIVFFLTENVCDAPEFWGMDVVNVSVILNNEGLSFRQVIDKQEEKLNEDDCLDSVDSCIPPNVSEQPMSYGGQEGVLVTRRGHSISKFAYVPFPDGQKILSIAILLGNKNSDFLADGQELLSTLRFVDASPSLVAMATQTAVSYIPPVVSNKTEYTSIDDLITDAPFRLWLPSYLPEGLSPVNRWVADLSDGSKQVGLLYSAEEDPNDNNVRRMTVLITLSSRLFTMEELYSRPGLEAQEIQFFPHYVQGYDGWQAYSYWTLSPSTGSQAHAEWSVGGLNFHIIISGVWTKPSMNPHYIFEYDVLEAVARSIEPH